MNRLKFTYTLVIILLILFFTTNWNGNDTYDIKSNSNIVFAHRGVTTNSPENTIGAIQDGIALKFSAFEVDLRTTKDNKLILFHDLTGERLLSDPRKIELVNWAELKTMKINFKGKATNHHLIEFSELCNNLSNNILLYLDIKNSNFKTANLLAKTIKEKELYNSVIVASTNFLFISYLKFIDPKIKTTLEGFNKGKEWIYFIIPPSFEPNYFASFLSEINENHMLFLKKQEIVNRKIVYGVNSGNIDDVLGYGIKHVIIDYDSSLFSGSQIEELLGKN